MSQKAKVIGIDPGAKRCGYSVFEFDVTDSGFENPELISSGVFGLAINRDEKETYSQYKVRLLEYAVEAFQDLLDDNEPDFLIFEFLPVTNAGAAAGQRLLAFAMATAGQVLCNLNAIPWFEITAVTVKKQMTGSGVATKHQVKNAVVELFPQLKNKKFHADETDAIAIPLAWMKRKNTES